MKQKSEIGVQLAKEIRRMVLLSSHEESDIYTSVEAICVHFKQLLYLLTQDAVFAGGKLRVAGEQCLRFILRKLQHIYVCAEIGGTHFRQTVLP